MSEDNQELEVPDPLDDQLEDIKVINEEDAKLYRARAVLANLDSDIYDFGPATIQVQPPVPVFTDDGKQIGFASVFFEGERVVADIGIDYASEERLLAETQSIKLYARLFGSLGLGLPPMYDFQAKVAVTRLNVHGIVLSKHRPTDERIHPFGSKVY